jgi:hypothetical protein
MFFFFFSGGQGSAQIAPLVLLLPALFQFLPFLLNGIVSTEAPTRAGHRAHNRSTFDVLSATNLVLPIIGIFGMIRFVRWVSDAAGA